MCLYFFFFNDTATTEIYTLSLHDALPILAGPVEHVGEAEPVHRVDDGAGPRDRGGLVPLELADEVPAQREVGQLDRKSTRLNSSHANISYAVFCLKKKKQQHALHHLPSYV